MLIQWTEIKTEKEKLGLKKKKGGGEGEREKGGPGGKDGGGRGLSLKERSSRRMRTFLH